MLRSLVAAEAGSWDQFIEAMQDWQQNTRGKRNY